MNEIQIEYIPINEIVPYKNNPRKNDKAVEIVANSIKQFGFKNPIILDKNNEIIAGHTRLKAAIKLNLKEVPVIWADDLTEDQVKAFRIMDNKSHEFSDWDINLLKGELHDLEDTDFLFSTGFNSEEIGDIFDDMDITKTDFKKIEIKLIFKDSEKLREVYSQIEPILEKHSIKIKMDRKLQDFLNKTKVDK